MESHAFRPVQRHGDLSATNVSRANGCGTSYGNLVMCYVDDVIIATGTVDEHIDRIGEVLSCLRRAGLKCKTSKCEFLKCSIKYLGRIVDKEGVRRDPETVETVMQWRRPRNKRELQSFLGFANYYREFIKNHSELVEPMSRLVKKNLDFEWNEEAQKAFDLTKEKLCSAPVLALPRYSLEMVEDLLHDVRHCGSLDNYPWRL